MEDHLHKDEKKFMTVCATKKISKEGAHARYNMYLRKKENVANKLFEHLVGTQEKAAESDRKSLNTLTKKGTYRKNPVRFSQYMMYKDKKVRVFVTMKSKLHPLNAESLSNVACIPDDRDAFRCFRAKALTDLDAFAVMMRKEITEARRYDKNYIVNLTIPPKQPKKVANFKIGGKMQKILDDAARYEFNRGYFYEKSQAEDDSYKEAKEFIRKRLLQEKEKARSTGNIEKKIFDISMPITHQGVKKTIRCALVAPTLKKSYKQAHDIETLKAALQQSNSKHAFIMAYIRIREATESKIREEEKKTRVETGQWKDELSVEILSRQINEMRSKDTPSQPQAKRFKQGK